MTKMPIFSTLNAKHAVLKVKNHIKSRFLAILSLQGF